MARIAALLTLLAVGSGCFSTRQLRLDDIAREMSELEEPVICRFLLSDGRTLRAMVNPREVVGPESIECHPCTHASSSWRVSYAGWPMVYSSGKYWRHELTGDVVQIPGDRIRQIWVEHFDWFRTVVAAPFCLPAGLLDFVARNAELGFDAINDRFDSFSRPPASPPPEEIPEPPVPASRETLTGVPDGLAPEDRESPAAPGF